MVVKITPNDKGNPVGKLAEAELHFSDGVLEGLKLIGFAIWERRGGNGRNVTFPARSYSVNGERRSFALLRPIGDRLSQDRIRDLAGLPFMLKGVQTAEDAEIAVQHGVDYIWVSNHGGRQIDHGLGSLDVQPDGAAAVALLGDAQCRIVLVTVEVLDVEAQQGADPHA